MTLELNDEGTDPYLFVWKHLSKNNIWNIQNNANILLWNKLDTDFAVCLGFGEQGIIWSKSHVSLTIRDKTVGF